MRNIEADWPGFASVLKLAAFGEGTCLIVGPTIWPADCCCTVESVSVASTFGYGSDLAGRKLASTWANRQGQ